MQVLQGILVLTKPLNCCIKGYGEPKCKEILPVFAKMCFFMHSPKAELSIYNIVRYIYIYIYVNKQCFSLQYNV